MELYKIEIYTKSAPMTVNDLKNYEYEYINNNHIIAISELRKLENNDTRYALIELSEKHYRFITENSWKNLTNRLTQTENKNE